MKLGIREFCEQMMDGKFADEDIYKYVLTIKNREDFLAEVTMAAILSDTNIDYIEKIEAFYKQLERRHSIVLLRLFKNNKELLDEFLEFADECHQDARRIYNQYKLYGNEVDTSHGHKEYLHGELKRLGLINITYSTFRHY